MDRNYWRSETTTRLVEEARTKGCELCIAMSERLEDAEHEGHVLRYNADGKISEALKRAEDAERDATNLDDKIYDLQCEVDKLELMLDQRDATIAKLEAAKKGDKK
tara:strand:- start:114 stop:431 length:318 start_codon:yes stop_codon:yes gene_type:complete